MARMASPISSIPERRLSNQHITRPIRGRPADIVARLGAVQAQEYPFAKWALALRLAGAASDADIEGAFEDGQILRTHVMRPTWHFVAAPDIVWMLELTAPRVHLTMASYLRRHALDTRLLRRATAIVERALGGRQHLTRAELRTTLARAGITLTALQMSFVTLYAELERVTCSGPRRGTQFTYALISERATRLRQLSRDEALGELAGRFFRSHGPATVRDFVWWSGLKTADAKRGLDIIRATSFQENGVTYWTAGRARAAAAPERPDVQLLPIYDEYLVAYRDRAAVPHGPGHVSSAAQTVTFQHALVIDGRVAGTWRTGRHRSDVAVTMLRPLSRAERRALGAAAERYGRFLGSPVSLSVA